MVTFTEQRQRMVEEQIIHGGITDRRVINAMFEVPRELFVPTELVNFAYDDGPLPIGYEQTISQPFIVAFMTEAAKIKPTSKVLEIGTGCGYQAAILSKLCKEIYSIEIVKPLAEEAAIRLKNLGYDNVHVFIGDGYEGCPDQAPFDAIIVTAAPKEIPRTLINQLKEGGRLICPVGRGFSQELVRITREGKSFEEEGLMPVRFVPMVFDNKN